ncbi:MAG: hypothetical protein JKY42_04805 [Flavobacteriales bacterium]|nr:hypothetical protein [Flavobacteriales bacterium]
MNQFKLTVLLPLFFLFCTTLSAQYKLRKATKNDLDGKCKACITVIKTIPIDVQWGLTVENGTIMFSITNAIYLEKLFATTKGLTVDIVSRDQYTCGKINKEPLLNNIKRGTLLEPIYYADFKNRIEINEKSGAALFKVAALPSEFKGKDYEMNLLFIKEGTVCYNSSFYGLATAQWELLKMDLYMDTIWQITAVEAKTKEVVKDYEKGFKFVIPFEKNKYEYKPEDIKPLYDSLRLTDYQIFNIDIHAYSSIEGTTVNNIKLQNKRAESIVAAMQTFQNESIATSVKASENWVEFFNDCEEEGLAIAKMSKSKIKEQLNQKGQSKELEYILKNHRKAVVTLDLKKRVSHLETSNETILTTYTKSLKDKDIRKALGAQQQLFERVGAYGVTEADFENMEIPDDSLFSTLRNNQLVFHYQQKHDAKSALAGFEALYEQYPKDLSILYNICALKVISWANGEMLMKPRKLKVDILKLQKGGFDYKNFQRLLLNFHIVRTSYSVQTENEDEMTRSINFVKGKYRRIDCDDEDMVRVAKFLANYNYANWAEDVLYRKAKQIDADPDLIFYYLNLTITNPENDNNERYKTIMYNAINQDPERFCKMFSNHDDGGVTFQMLSNTYLKKIYCENCEKEKKENP